MRRNLYMVLWPGIAILQLIDIATTAVALNTRAAMEANPTARHIMQSFGQPVAYVVKAALVTAVLLALYHYRTRLWAQIAAYAGLTLSVAAAINNIAFLTSAHP